MFFFALIFDFLLLLFFFLIQKGVFLTGLPVNNTQQDTCFTDPLFLSWISWSKQKVLHAQADIQVIH